MNASDLTPRSYRVRCRQRMALRYWALAVAVCGLFAIATISLESTRHADLSNAVIHEQIQQARLRTEQTQAKVQSLTTLLQQYERELQAQEHLTRRPDWSDVMGRVSSQFQGQVMTGFRLGPASQSNIRAGLGSIATSVPADSIWLVLTGVAGANSDVSGLILRLEELKLFERVVMTETRRESFAGSPRTGFVLACRVQ